MSRGVKAREPDNAAAFLRAAPTMAAVGATYGLPSWALLYKGAVVTRAGKRDGR